MIVIIKSQGGIKRCIKILINRGSIRRRCNGNSFRRHGQIYRIIPHAVYGQERFKMQLIVSF